jgi:MerR family transcriptional regulator, light-induced transcriptional regulator
LARFSIKDIENLSGIKSHTLRIWEQRYGILKPSRTDTNIRYYNDSDLKLILNIRVLNNNGYKISAIARMTPKQIQEAVLQVNERDHHLMGHVDSLVTAMLTLDEVSFNKILSTCILQQGLENTMLNVIFPLMREIGMLWQTGSIHVAHEHFISYMVKQKLYVAIEGQSWLEKPGTQNFLLFLREDEPHEIGLLFANYLLRTRGHRVIYLGKRVPHHDLQQVFEAYLPGYLLTSITNHLSDDVMQEYVNELSSTWPDATVIITGPQVESFKGLVPSNVRMLRNFAYFIALIDELSRGEIQN